jgi:shikimate kinase
MKKLKEKYNVVWLDVDLELINDRKNKEARERPIVYPEGINSFEELYNQRVKLYPLYTTHHIKISTTEPPEKTLEKILLSLKE